MRVLVACEYSGTVREAFRARGHDAWSCDLLESDDSSDYHYQGDVFDFIEHEPLFDLIIAHPPCTHLCVSGNRYHAGTQDRLDAAEFVRKVWELPCAKMCIENPVGVINRLIPDMPKPQYVQPYEFGHDASKKTGLWTRGLPMLRGSHLIEPRVVNGKHRWANQTDSGQNKLTPSADRWKIRSKTYEGLANAMAEQWGCG